MKTSSEQNQPSRQVGGLPCPRCHNLIQFPILALLNQTGFTCTQCGLELNIDPQRSAAALKELHRYTAGLEDAQGSLGDNKPG
jgi:hypothetical protein